MATMIVVTKTNKVYKKDPDRVSGSCQKPKADQLSWKMVPGSLSTRKLTKYGECCAKSQVVVKGCTILD